MSKGLFSRPTTDAERRAWQQRSYELLGDLLKIGRDRRLPVITWRVSEFTLVGEPFQVEDGDRRAAFEAWADALRLTRHEPVASMSGCTSLRATAANWHGRRVDVAVTANVYGDGLEG